MLNRRNLAGGLSLLLLVGAHSGNAFANTAAGVTITNNATLTYNGGVTATSSVTVSVALKATSPNLTISGGSATYTGVNTPAIAQNVVITATSNGPADYNVSVATGTQANNDAVSVGTFTGSANTQTPYSAAAPTNLNILQLGATVTVGASGQTYVTVPATTGAVDGTSINGITVGSHILIVNENNSNSHEVTVAGIADQHDGTYRISWNGAILASDVPGVGNVVGERRVLNFYAYPGTVRTAGTNITVAVNATATNNGLTFTTTTPAANSWGTSAPTAQFVKYVRNTALGAPAGNGGSDTFGGNTYYRSNVTAKPGETLEYLIVATNTDGANPLTGCAISDLLPTGSYATFLSNAYGTNKDITYSYANPTDSVSYLQAYTSGTHQATLVGQTLSVNVGTSASDTAGGNVAPSAKVKILYQLTVN